MDKTFFYQSLKNDLRTCDVGKIAIAQRDDYTIGCLLDYPYFKEDYKLIAIDLSKQQALDFFLEAITQINFTGNLELNENTTRFLNTEEAQKTVLDFSQGTARAL